MCNYCIDCTVFVTTKLNGSTSFRHTFVNSSYLHVFGTSIRPILKTSNCLLGVVPKAYKRTVSNTLIVKPNVRLNENKESVSLNFKNRRSCFLKTMLELIQNFYRVR